MNGVALGWRGARSLVCIRACAWVLSRAYDRPITNPNLPDLHVGTYRLLPRGSDTLSSLLSNLPETPCEGCPFVHLDTPGHGTSQGYGEDTLSLLYTGGMATHGFRKSVPVFP